MRGAAAFLVAATVLLVPTPAALAWGNGVDGPNAFGTHDWILNMALSGVAPGDRWVCRRAAFRATDDPDTDDGIDHASGTWWHVWDEWGATYGGAPEAVEVWFERIQNRLRDGRECAASRALGIMAHLVGDVAEPMHTDGALAAEDRVHSAYESDVDSQTEVGDVLFDFDFDGIDDARARSTALSVARQAHRSYRVLVTTYDDHGYNARVDRITQRQLNRAANALADLIAAVV